MYCKKACGESGFSIDEWNKQFTIAVNSGIDTDKLFPDDRQFALGIECEEQCFDCMAIVGERRLKTKQL